MYYSEGLYTVAGCIDEWPSRLKGIFLAEANQYDKYYPWYGSMYDYHWISVGKLTDYYDTGASFVESRGALFYTHIAEEEWILAGNRGSMQN